MQYAMVQATRTEAVKGGRGTCPICGVEVIAKCGPRILHHWAHARGWNCDPWWENETRWHRDWKARFPADCREVAHVATDGEVHRADVVTPTGIVVEIQNSPISDTERKSREAFYGNMVWVVNGAAFREQFYILHQLPDPASDLARDLVWFPARADEAGTSGGVFWRRSENADHLAGETTMVQIHGMHRIQEDVWEAYRGHHQYNWIRPRVGWLESGCTVYIDLGDEWLWQLCRYGETDLRCARRVAKAKFVHDAMTEARAADIATRFYPVRNAADSDAA
jgi:competence protein CoiA